MPSVYPMILTTTRQRQCSRLYDSVQGHTVSFRHSLIIMTSNVGSAAISNGAPALGFQLGIDGADAEEAAYGHIRARVNEELKVFMHTNPFNMCQL